MSPSGTPATAVAAGATFVQAAAGHDTWDPAAVSLQTPQQGTFPTSVCLHVSSACRRPPVPALLPRPRACSAAVVVRASAESRRAVLGGLVAGVAALTASSAQVRRLDVCWVLAVWQPSLPTRWWARDS